MLICVWLAALLFTERAGALGQSARLPPRRRARDDPLRQRDGLHAGLGARSGAPLARSRRSPQSQRRRLPPAHDVRVSPQSRRDASRTRRNGGSGRSTTSRSRISIRTTARTRATRRGAASTRSRRCRIPSILWFGLLCVPLVAVLAWRERNKGYVLIVVTYLAAVAAVDRDRRASPLRTTFT